MPRTVDYSALIDPVTPADVTSFRTRVQNIPAYSSAASIVALVLVGIAGSFLVMITLGMIVLLAATGIGIIVIPLLLLMLAGVVVVVVLGFRGKLGSARWERWMRLDGFAATNNLIFSPSDPNPAYPGAIFARGSSRAAVDHFRSATERFLDYGNFQYVTSNGKSSTTHRLGFMALQLDRSLPHMVMDSLANNGLFGSNLATFTKDQVLSLEGDFNNYFTLYCPKEYERDALYVFTPDLMALLIDEAAPFDVEIIDRWMFVYCSRSLDMLQPTVHYRLLRIVETIGAKTLTQTDLYHDERIPTFAANAVAPQGQRLKRSWVPFIVFLSVFVGLFLLGPIAFVALGVLFSQ